MESHCFLGEIASPHLTNNLKASFPPALHPCFMYHLETCASTSFSVFLHLQARPVPSATLSWGFSFCLSVPLQTFLLPSCSGGNLVILKSLEWLLEVQFRVFLYTAIMHLPVSLGLFPPSFMLQWLHGMALASAVPTEYFQLLSTKLISGPTWKNPFQIHRCCAVWMLFCVTLPWVVCVCPLSCPYLLGPSDCQEHICSVEYIEAVRMMSFK